MKKRYRKNVWLAVICVVLAVVYYSVFIQPCSDDNGQEENLSLQISDFTLSGIDYDSSKNSLVTTTTDPIMIADIEDTYIGDLNICFDKVTEPDCDWQLQVFYTLDDKDDFKEENSVVKDVKKTEKEIKLNIDKNVTKLRVDLGNECGRSFYINSVEVNPMDRAFHVYNLPMPFLVFVTALCLYAMYCLIVFVQRKYVLNSVTDGERRKATAICAIIMYVLIAISLVLCADKLQKTSFRESDLTEASFLSVNDLTGNAPDYHIVGNDPFVVYEIKDGTYGRGIVYFDGKTSENIMYKVYYSSQSDHFSEERKVVCSQKKGTDFIAFELPDDYEFCFVRVDYEGGQSGLKGGEFHIERVCCVEKSLAATLHGLFSLQTWLRLLVLTLVFLFFFVIIYRKNGLLESYNQNTRLRTGFEIAFIFIMPMILFWQYIIGKKTFIFSDVAADSIKQLYPTLLHIADRIENGQWSEMFSFIIGMGDKEKSIMINILNWPSLFGKENIAWLMGIGIFLKVALSGLITYGFVTLWGIKDEKRLLVTFGYEFNAMLTIRSCWEAYANVAFMVILWLYCFELMYAKKEKKYSVIFAFASFIFFFQFDVYYCVLYGFLFAVYILCRTLSDGKGIKYASKTCVLNYLLFAFFGTADNCISSLAESVSSDRVSGGVNAVAGNLSDHLRIQWDMLYEAFIRGIGQAISGVSDDFVGLFNVLEGPAFYFGILMLMMVPLAVYNLPGKKKYLFALGLLASLLFILFPLVRELVAGFSGDSFKYTSFWITILMVLSVLEAFKNIKENGYRRNSLFVFNMTGAVFCVLLISVLFTDKIARMSQWWMSLIYCVIYLLSVNLIYVYKYGAIKMVVTLAVISEGVVLSFTALNDRTSWTQDELEELFYDDVYTAIHENTDDSDWYRIERYPYTISWCDSYVQNYYGTSSYIGGVGIGEGVRNYYREMGLPEKSDSRWLYGTSGNIYANALLGVKYIYLENMVNYRYGTEYVGSNHDVDIYENSLALPIGYFYENVMEEDEFYSLSVRDRNREILNRCLVRNPSDGEVSQDTEKETVQFEGTPKTIQFLDSDKRIDVSGDKNKVIVLDIHFLKKQESEKTDYEGLEERDAVVDDEESSDGADGLGTFYIKNSEGKLTYQEFSYTGVLEICADDADSIWFDDDTAEKIDYVNVYAYNPEEYYADTVKAVHKLQTNGMEITSMDDYSIDGTVTAPTDGVFATSIPFDSNWEIYIDGEQSEVLEVNTGFIGTKMSKGSHNVRIYYRHRTWLESNEYIILGFCVLILYGIYACVYDFKKRRLTYSGEEP